MWKQNNLINHLVGLIFYSTNYTGWQTDFEHAIKMQIFKSCDFIISLYFKVELSIKD